MHVVIAPDCFTGTLTATQAAEAIGAGWAEAGWTGAGWTGADWTGADWTGAD